MRGRSAGNGLRPFWLLVVLREEDGAGGSFSTSTSSSSGTSKHSASLNSSPWPYLDLNLPRPALGTGFSGEVFEDGTGNPFANL